VLTDANTGDTRNIHMQVNLVSVGGQYEYVDKLNYEYPSFNKHAVKVDAQYKSHQSAATGSLTVSGGLQYINASQSGFVGAGTTRGITITR